MTRYIPRTDGRSRPLEVLDVERSLLSFQRPVSWRRKKASDSRQRPPIATSRIGYEWGLEAPVSSRGELSNAVRGGVWGSVAAALSRRASGGSGACRPAASPQGGGGGEHGGLGRPA